VLSGEGLGAGNVKRQLVHLAVELQIEMGEQVVENFLLAGSIVRLAEI
jgi:hypothetical protein